MPEINETDGKFKSPQEELNAMASVMSGVVPGGGGWVVPHAQQSIGLYSGGRFFYLNRDEALRVSRQDARNMLRNLDIRVPLQERMLSVAELQWSIEPEDRKDKHQLEIAKELQNVIEQTPDFVKFLRQLLWAIWFGRSAVQIKYEWRYMKGRKYLIPARWDSVHGDNLCFHYNDDGIGIFLLVLRMEILRD